MKAWECSNCGAEIKEEKSPQKCPLCHTAGPFSTIEIREPTKAEKEGTEKYEEIIEDLNTQEDGCDSIKKIDRIGGEKFDAKDQWRHSWEE